MTRQPGAGLDDLRAAKRLASVSLPPPPTGRAAATFPGRTVQAEACASKPNGAKEAAAGANYRELFLGEFLTTPRFNDEAAAFAEGASALLEDGYDISSLMRHTMEAANELNGRVEREWWDKNVAERLASLKEVASIAQPMASEMLTKWGGDILELDRISCGHALYFIGINIFTVHNLTTYFRIDRHVLRHFLLKLEQRHTNHPFSNSAHTADMLLHAHLFLTSYGMIDRLSREQLLALFLVALLHNLSHPGTSNALEVQSHSFLAQTYGDTNVIERHRLAAAFSILHQDSFNVLAKLSEAQANTVRSLTVDLVVKADMEMYCNILLQLDALGRRRGGNFGAPTSSPNEHVEIDPPLLMLAILKWAELNFLWKAWPLHSAWAGRLELQIAQAADRAEETQPNRLSTSQLGLGRLIGLPLLNQLTRLLGVSMEARQQLQRNLSTWKMQTRKQREETRDIVHDNGDVDEGSDSWLMSHQASTADASKLKILSALLDVEGSISDMRFASIHGSEFDKSQFERPFRELVGAARSAMRHAHVLDGPPAPVKQKEQPIDELRPATHSVLSRISVLGGLNLSVQGESSGSPSGAVRIISGPPTGPPPASPRKRLVSGPRHTTASESSSSSSSSSVSYTSSSPTSSTPTTATRKVQFKLRDKGRDNSFTAHSLSEAPGRSFKTTMHNWLKRAFTFSPAVAHWDLSRQLGSGDEETDKMLEPSAFDFYAALLFVDISGFTPLCALVDVDAVQGHINRYFTQLVELISAHGGDVIRYAGDALLVAWSLPLQCSQDLKEKVAKGACSCALQLVNTGSYFIKQLDAHLRISAGVGLGPVTGMRVGSKDRWEFVLTGGPVRQVTEAESQAAPGEVICSPQVWAQVENYVVGQPRGGSYHVISSPPFNLLHDEQMRHELLGYDLFTDSSIFSRDELVVPLMGFVHPNVRELLKGGHTHMAERRSIVTVFCMIHGLEKALDEGSDGLAAVQACLEVAMDCISAAGGLLRQFMLDDKGVVCIWNFGLSSNVFEDSAARGLQSCMDVRAELSSLGLDSQIGITSGSAFCGLVGSPSYRCEYGVMGASVNLAARLMCKAEDVLCNDELVREHAKSKLSLSSFTFEALAPMKVKGYAELVTIFRPRIDKMRQVVHDLLQPMDMFSTLGAKQQLAFLDAMQHCFFKAGDKLVTEGEMGDRLYVIVDGEVTVTKESKARTKTERGSPLVKLGKGHFFGEMALLQSIPRTATVTALTDTVCVSIDRDTFLSLADDSDLLLRQTARRHRLEEEEASEDAPRLAHTRNASVERLKQFSEELFEHGGRHEEGEVLAAQVESLLATGKPSVTHITGEAGLGKTHLLVSLRKKYLSVVPVVYVEACTVEDDPLSSWCLVARMMLALACDVPLAQLSLVHVFKLLPSLTRLDELSHQYLLKVVEDQDPCKARRSPLRPKSNSKSFNLPRQSAFCASPRGAPQVLRIPTPLPSWSSGRDSPQLSGRDSPQLSSGRDSPQLSGRVSPRSSRRSSGMIPEISIGRSDIDVMCEKRVLLQVFQRVLELSPHVIIIDDSHHLSQPCLELLHELLCMQLPVAVVLAARSHAFRQDAVGGSMCSRVLRLPVAQNDAEMSLHSDWGLRRISPVWIDQQGEPGACHSPRFPGSSGSSQSASGANSPKIPHSSRRPSNTILGPDPERSISAPLLRPPSWRWSSSSASLVHSRLGPEVVIRHVELQPMDWSQVQRIISAKCINSKAISDSLKRALHERSGGHPMFLLQLLQEAQRTEANSRFQLFSPKTGERQLYASISKLPLSIHDSVLSSFATASVALQSLLKLASVLACPGLQEHRVLRIENSMLLGLHPGSIADVIALLQSTEISRFLVRDGSARTPSIRFRNSVACEVIYSLLLRSQRQQTHALAAHWLERLQRLNACEERLAIIQWHWFKSTTETEECLRFSTIVTLSRAKEPWISPPPGVSPAVIEQMGGFDIQARLELVPVMDLDSMPEAIKITEDGLGRTLGTEDHLAELSDMVVQPLTPPVNVVMVTNQNDLLPLIFARTLISMRAIELKAVLVNLPPCLKRVRRARHALDSLALYDVPVGMGSDVLDCDSSLYGSIKRFETECFPDHKTGSFQGEVRRSSGNGASPSARSLENSPTTSRRHTTSGHTNRSRVVELNGFGLLCDVYRDAEPESLTLLLLSAMTDAARLILEEEELFISKTRQVVVMGGALNSSLGEDSPCLIGDDSARNHLLDTRAANYVFRRCQELGVQLLVVTRHAAYGCALPYFFFDELALDGDPLAVEARDQYVMAVQVLWRQLHLPSGDRNRAELPPRCDLRWFYDMFCGGMEVTPSASGIAPHLATVVLHDVIALLACCPDALENFFEVEVKSVKPLDTDTVVNHMVVGLSNTNTGIAEGRKLRELFTYGFQRDTVRRGDGVEDCEAFALASSNSAVGRRSSSSDTGS